jgi:hypothetical protein
MQNPNPDLFPRTSSPKRTHLAAFARVSRQTLSLQLGLYREFATESWLVRVLVGQRLLLLFLGMGSYEAFIVDEGGSGEIGVGFGDDGGGDG